MSRPNSTITVSLEPEIDPVGVKKFQAILSKPGIKAKIKDHVAIIWNNGTFRSIMSKQAGLTEKLELYESMYYVNDKGKAFDDEGNSWDTHASPGHYKNLRAPKPKMPSLYQTREYMFGRALEALPDKFTLKNVSDVVNDILAHVELTYKQKFGILINKAKAAGKKQI